MAAKIVITVSGGVVQDVEGVPEGVQVCIRDYDVEGETVNEKDQVCDWDGNPLPIDDNGDPYLESIHECQ